MTISLLEKSELVTQAIQHIEQNNISLAVQLLRQQASYSDEIPRPWLLNVAEALESDNWSLLSQDFINMDFIGKNGYFLMIAPYQINRKSQSQKTLSAIYGKVEDYSQPSIEQLENLVRKTFGTLNEPVPLNLSFTEIASFGNTKDETGEAFVVPVGWLFPDSVLGPALNNATEQRKRFFGSSHACIRTIFDEETASLLLAPLEDPLSGERYRHVDTQVHEAGHASGLGFNFKVKHNLFQNYTYSGIEEWRSDSLGFEFAAATLSPEEAGKLVAVNFCIRFGLDAHRLGGMEKDTDVYAALISLEHLFQNDAIYITSKGQLALRNLSYPGLLQAVEFHRTQALSLTRRELNINHLSGFFSLYQIDIHPATKSIFQGLIVESCKGNWANLQ